MSLKQLFRNKGEKIRDKFVDDVKDFCTNKKRKNYIVIVADPASNTIVSGFKTLITAFNNPSESRKLSEMFDYEPHADMVEGKQVVVDDPIDSKRNMAIREFLFRIDAIVDAFGKELYNRKKANKDLDKLIDAGLVKFGSEVKNEKGNTAEIKTLVK